MEILTQIQRAFAFLGFIPGNRIFRFQFVHSIISLLVLSLLVAFAATSVVYVKRNLQAGYIENSLEALFQLSGTIPLIASFFTIVYHRQKVRSVIDSFQQIFDKCEKKSSAIYFHRANELSEKFYKVAMAAIFGGHLCSSVALAVIVAIFYIVRDGHVEPNNLFLPHKLSTPFNESTYIGWAFNFFLQMVSGLIFILVNLSTVTFVIAIGLYFEACTKHFRVMFMDLNQIAGQNATIKMRLKMKSSIVAAIHFHRTTKSIFELSREIMSGTICFQLMMNVVFMSITFFDLEMALKHLDPSTLVLLFSANTSTGTTFLYCFIGSLTTEQFLLYSDIVYECEWHKLPINLQKLLQLMIIDAQRPHIFHGFGFIDLNLTTFLKLVKTVVTYYMLFKKVTN